jgi:hypothetical protein
MSSWCGVVIFMLAAVLAPAALPAQPIGAPTIEEVRRALNKPRLNYCDEIICAYRPPRDFSIRSLHCKPLNEEEVLCAYERTAFDPTPVKILRIGEPVPPDTRSWSTAETKLRKLEHGWMVIGDSDD